jgi:hypothetical protein
MGRVNLALSATMPSVMTPTNIKSPRIDSGEMSWESLINAAIRLLVAPGDRLRAEAAQVAESILQNSQESCDANTAPTTTWQPIEATGTAQRHQLLPAVPEAYRAPRQTAGR